MAMDKLSTARAEDILGQVRRQLRREVLFPVRNSAIRLYIGTPRVWESGGAQQSHTIGADELAERLQATYRSLDNGFAASAAGIGQMPDVAPTLRGTVGRIVIGVIQRLLWWHTGSLKSFAHSVAAHLQNSTETVEVMACMLRINQLEISALREEVRILRENQVNRPEIDR